MNNNGRTMTYCFEQRKIYGQQSLGSNLHGSDKNECIGKRFFLCSPSIQLLSKLIFLKTYLKLKPDVSLSPKSWVSYKKKCVPVSSKWNMPTTNKPSVGYCLQKIDHINSLAWINNGYLPVVLSLQFGKD